MGFSFNPLDWVGDIVSSAVNAKESGMNRDLSRDEAGRAREQETIEAEKNRDWQHLEREDVQGYNTAEAEKSRAWQDKSILGEQQFNALQAQQNRDFQEKMSSTAVQRAVADYKKAGINPILAVPGGASTPSGSLASAGHGSGATASSSAGGGSKGGSAHASFSSGGDITQGLRNLLSNSIDSNRLKKELELADKDKVLKDAQVIETLERAKATKATANKIKAETPGAWSESETKANKAKGGFVGEKSGSFILNSARQLRDSIKDLNTLRNSTKDVHGWYKGSY